jgi:flagellar hook protein FlgE
MGLTSALFTGLSGISSAQFKLDVIGDNIANVNTVGFKGARSLFQTQFSQTFSSGTRPGELEGGTNPSQIGLGSVLGAVQRIFQPGSIETTGFPTDLAVEGEGFFVLRTALNEQVFSRDGAFSLSALNKLVSQDGFFVQGYGVNENFEVVPGVLKDLEVPLGVLTTAQATSRVTIDGSLNSNGDISTQGNILESQVFTLADGATPIAAGTLLTDVHDPAVAPLAPLWAVGDTITINGVTRGGREIAEESFTVQAGSTVQDFLDFMDDQIGIDTSAATPGNPGVAVTAAGQLQFRSNVGTANAIDIQAGTIISTGNTNPFTFTETQDAIGESISTSFIVYDSLGTPLTVSATATLESRNDAMHTWRFYVHADQDTDSDTVIGTGTITFDSNGQFLESTGQGIVIDRANTGAATPLTINLDFNQLSGLTVRESALIMSNQDGFATGTLIDFGFGSDGVLIGTFSNGQARPLGQVVLATFANNAGLVQRSNNTFFAGSNSGEAQITAPQVLGAGRILAGSLELSNVDLSREFVGLIQSSTAFSAASRVISTSDQLLQELLLLGRR